MKARKRFSQNFLIDQMVIQRILHAIDPQPDDHIVEIGPGRGAITRGLLARAGTLTVVEIDRDLASLLLDEFGEALHLHQADVLATDIGSFYDGRLLRIVGNLPYHISTPLIFKLFESIHLIGDMYFMLQKEVVDRMVAEPSTGDYGRLSIMAQYVCRIEKCFEVPPSAFRPSPSVQSAVVRLIPHQQQLGSETDREQLNTIVTAAFSKRRKTIRNALRGVIDRSRLEEAGIDLTLRPENLSLQQYVLLSKLQPATRAESQ